MVSGGCGRRDGAASEYDYILERIDSFVPEAVLRANRNLDFLCS